MEEPQEILILLNTLSKFNVPIPPEASSVKDLTPEALISICAHSLRIISNSQSFPITLPDSMADRFTVCTDLALLIKDLGYIGDISFHKFLYPTEEDMYKLIRFLVGKLSESSQTAVSPETENENAAAATIHVDILERSIKDADDEGQDLHTKVEDLKLRTDDVASHSNQYAEDVVTVNGDRRGKSESINVRLTGTETSRGLTDDKLHEDGQHKLEQSTISIQDKSSQTSGETEIPINRENMFSDEMKAKSVTLRQLEEQHDLLKAATEMACDEQTPLESYVTQLSKQIDEKRHNLAEMESKWKAIIKPLQEKKINFEEALCAKQPESREKHRQWKKLEQDLESTLSETNQREKELSNLSAEVERLPKLATRRSYIERIKEITKNSRKQDIDIERILKDTRDLQMESNMIQERLHRTYAVVDETLLREAKKDQVGEQAHILLTTIHESFQEISEKILAADRTRREETDLETKLSSIATRSLNMDKLQADLDAIRKENEYLESRLSNP